MSGESLYKNRVLDFMTMRQFYGLFRFRRTNRISILFFFETFFFETFFAGKLLRTCLLCNCNERIFMNTQMRWWRLTNAIFSLIPAGIMGVYMQPDTDLKRGPFFRLSKDATRYRRTCCKSHHKFPVKDCTVII